MTPLPKGGFGPPSYGAFSTPLGRRCSVFPVQKSTTEQTRSSFGGGPEFIGRARSLVRFLAPNTFCTPPPYHGPSGCIFLVWLWAGRMEGGQGRKNSININFLCPDFSRTLLTLTPGCPGGQKVSPHHRDRRKTHFLVRTSTIFSANVHDPKGRRKTLY